MDEAFRIPGTNFRFGWDPIIGIIPGFGDLLTGLLSLVLLSQAFRFNVPTIIKARMILNLLIDVVVGSIPFIGDILDFGWKSNSLNLALLEKHAGTGANPGIGDWAFVLGFAVLVFLFAAASIFLMVALYRFLSSWIHEAAIGM